MTLEERKAVENEILRHVPKYSIKVFTWNDKNELSFDGNIAMYENSTLTAPNLTSIGGHIAMYKNSTLTLPNLTSVGGDIDMYKNSTLTAPNLTSIGGNIDMYENSTLTLSNLTSIGENIHMRDNSTLTAPNLTSVGRFVYIGEIYKLEAPNLVNKDFVKDMQNGEERHNFIKTDNIAIQYISKKKHKRYTIYTTPFKSSHIQYVLFDGTYYSHCATLAQGILDIEFKKNGGDVSRYEGLTLDNKLTYNEAIIMYRSITRACSGGTQYFLDTHNFDTKKKYSIREIIELTKGQYEHKRLTKFFNLEE